MMNIIYKLYLSIEDFLLEKYLVEFYFFTEPSNTLDHYNKQYGTMYRGDFKCYLPILFMVKNYDELEGLVSTINNQLIKEYGCSIIRVNLSEKIGTQQMIDHIIRTSTNNLKGYKKGTLDIMTFTPRPTDQELEIKYSTRKDRYTFQIIRTGRVGLLKDNFTYLIQFFKNTTEE